MGAFCSHMDHATDGDIMKALRPGFWPLAGYIALTLAMTVTILLFAGGELGPATDLWGFVALLLGVPWSAIALTIDDFVPNADRAVLTILALSVPANALLLYLLGRMLDRRWSSRLQN
jgi:hypothetical protein